MNRPQTRIAAFVLTMVAALTGGPGARAGATAPTRESRTAYAVLIVTDRSGTVVYRHRYGPGSEGTTMRLPRVVADHGTGGASTASGSATVTVHQTDTVLGLDTLWNFRIDVTWSWDRADETVSPTAYGYTCCGNSLDSSWGWDGVVARDNHYSIYDTTPVLGLTSGFSHAVWGHYDGPAVGSINRNEYPEDIVDVHDDGTWFWETHCCASPPNM